MDLLKNWQDASGLKINWRKISLIGIGVDKSEVERYSKRIGCKMGDGVINYLGVPINVNMKNKMYWEKVIWKFDSRMAVKAGNGLSARFWLPRCQEVQEDIHHALVKRNKVAKIWKDLFKWWDLDFKVCENLKEVCNRGLVSWSANQKKVWDAVVKTTAYGIWRNRNELVFKGKEMTKYLNDFQFGVGVSGGTEAVLHSVNRVLSARHSDGSLAMLTVDFSNAFNLVDRASLLHEHIWSTTGVQQGDPLGPLLFALVLHPLVYKIRDNCKLLLHAWYLDDGTVIGDSEEVAKDWTFYGVGRPVLGVKLLGGAVSRDASFISRLAMKRAAGAVDLMRLLPQLCDPQSELLLLRSCMGIAKLFFGLRTCEPVYMEEAALLFDKGLRLSIEDMVVCGGPFSGDIQWRLASLPIRFGGLGLYSATEASSYAFVASRAQPWALQDHILRGSGVCDINSDYVCALASLHELASALFSKIVKGMEVDYDMTVRQKAVFECLQAPHAQDFLLAIPIDGLGQHMSPVEYRIILKYRLMIPLFPVDEACPVCRKPCLDSFGEHAIHCRELPGFKYRHDMVRDVLVDVFRRVGISVKKEAPVNFLTDPSKGRSTLRPDEILIFGLVGGKHACVDLTGVSPFVGLGSGCFTVGQAALKAASFKVIKHEKV
ncbi:hypothetical protein Tco_0453494 [Tanacetum coccineum]